MIVVTFPYELSHVLYSLLKVWDVSAVDIAESNEAGDVANDGWDWPG